VNLTGFRYVNYIDEYLDKVLNYYSRWSPHFFVNYYKFKYSESILDDIKDTRTASYHMAGDLSGRKWDKILMFPVWYSTGVSEISIQNNEFSLNREIELSLSFPDILGVPPTSEDFIEFRQGEYIDSETDEPIEHPLFVVKNYEVSHIGNRRWYKINIKNHFLIRTELEKKVNQRYMYINHLSEIYDLETSYNILEIQRYFFSYLDYFNKMDIGYSYSFTNLIGVK